MIDQPRVSEKTLYGIIALRPKNSEEVSLALDLIDARDELHALASMVLNGAAPDWAEGVHATAKGHVPPEVEFAYDIQMRYGWGATDK